ncbi:hypothetical protein M011DRAFT_22583 [Sporormia fimetaria CBS 119925]|uniref:RING-type domain-containing protein n=1 Tax=Sporormia fimetaria CBS 119925 TaxID=1340428 RepID=A0A6A6VSX4_9PLEO|nr:hypothetical protein M011DRAFT_22583 [Sporormia fimetaria CBS 119925]
MTPASCKSTLAKFPQKQRKQQPPCPHVWHTVPRTDLTPQELSSVCIICLDPWSEEPEEEIQTIPGRLAHCGHPICEHCFTEWQSQLEWANCPFPWCEGQKGPPPANLVSCRLCQEIHSKSEDLEIRTVITIRDTILENLKLELRKLATTDDFFRISDSRYTALLRYWRQVLQEYWGQYHRWWEFAEVLDPFRGADVVHRKVIKQYGPLLEPMPDRELRGYLEPHTPVEDYPNGEEPWISTVIRDVLSMYHEEDHKDVPYGSPGGKEYEKYQQTHPHVAETLDGEHLSPWPIHKLLEHRVENGRIEYLVQHVGDWHKESFEWTPRGQFVDKKIYKNYDAELRRKARRVRQATGRPPQSDQPRLHYRATRLTADGETQQQTRRRRRRPQLASGPPTVTPRWAQRGNRQTQTVSGYRVAGQLWAHYVRVPSSENEEAEEEDEEDEEEDTDVGMTSDTDTDSNSDSDDASDDADSDPENANEEEDHH